MTVIAYKDGLMAADTQSWHIGIRHAEAVKIVRLPDGSLFGAAGWQPEIERAQNWLANGADPTIRPAKAEEADLEGILLKPDGSVWTVAHTFDVYRTNATTDAVGSQKEFLYGAMAAGASAEEAVRLAIKCCGNAGGDVQVMRLNDGN